MKRRESSALALLFMFFLLPLSLPFVNWASQGGLFASPEALFHSGRLTFLRSNFAHFTLLCLLASIILDSFSYSNYITYLYFIYLYGFSQSQIRMETPCAQGSYFILFSAISPIAKTALDKMKMELFFLINQLINLAHFIHLYIWIILFLSSKILIYLALTWLILLHLSDLLPSIVIILNRTNWMDT